MAFLMKACTLLEQNPRGISTGSLNQNVVARDCRYAGANLLLSQKHKTTIRDQSAKPSMVGAGPRPGLDSYFKTRRNFRPPVVSLCNNIIPHDDDSGPCSAYELDSWTSASVTACDWITQERTSHG